MSYKQLMQHFTKLSHLSSISGLAGWDEQVMMPTGSGDARADAMATLHGLQHELLTQPSVADWLKAAKEEPLDHWDSSNLTWMNKKHQYASCLPQDLVEAHTRASMRSEQAWRTMRSDNNWKDFAPLLEESFSLTLEMATLRGEALGLAPYDAMLDEYCCGESEASIDPIFSQLADQLPALIQQIIDKQQAITLKPIKGPFDTSLQKELSIEAMTSLGFDFNHGRLDISHHPFCSGNADDTRITTRYNNEEFLSSLMGTCHETGHARYEQQLPEQWRTQPVGQIHSMAMHESQSLLIEMQACRTLEFMTFLSPRAKHYFGDQAGLEPSNLYHHYTHVEPGLIRVDADEACYPLHVILRYDIEKKLFSGDISIHDLPDIWDHTMQQFFGLSTRDNDKDGVMQDVHWPSGAFGYFPAYTLGRLIAAQLFQQLITDQPDSLTELATGNSQPIFTWLKKHVHQYASSLTSTEILTQATGLPLTPQCFMDHLKQRYL